MIRKLQEKGIRFPLIAVVGLVLFALLAFALPAHAVNEGIYPRTVYDTNCTDAFNVPAAGSIGVRPSPQISGSADSRCDHDSRILAAAVTADTTFGPFTLKSGQRSVVVYVDADVVSNDTDTWNIRILEKRPHDLVVRPVHAVADQTTEGNKTYLFAPSGFTYGAVTVTVNGEIPAVFFIELNVVTATSWDGSISWAGF